MLIDRTLEPTVEIPSEIFVPRAEKFLLKNGVPCFTVHAPEQDVLRIEFIFRAGSIHEPKRLVASATNDLLDEGTRSRTAKDIAAHFDFYGASLQTECGTDTAAVTLYTLGKFLKETLPLAFEVINEPVFPAEELQTFVIQHRQKLAVSNKKVEFVARKTLAEKLFGSNHPYGYYVTEKDFEQLERDELQRFHAAAYNPETLTVIASGNVTEEVKKALDLYFGKSFQPNVDKIKTAHATNGAIVASAGYLERSDALQSAIRIGRKMFNKTHPDFVGMSILNTLLGGYFGSRLMSNIREDKGFTYGIGSAMVSLQQAGYFFIATEVGAQVTNETLKEIYGEIDRLQQEPVGKEELRIVKNYLVGAFMRSIDGPFAQADKLKGIYFYGLDYGYYDRYLEILRTISPEDLRELAVKYLNKSELTEVVVGKK